MTDKNIGRTSIIQYNKKTIIIVLVIEMEERWEVDQVCSGKRCNHRTSYRRGRRKRKPMIPIHTKAIICVIVLLMATVKVSAFVPQKLFEIPSTIRLRAFAEKHKRLRVHRRRLHRVVKSIEYYGQAEGVELGASDVLLNALRMLLNAKTQSSVSQAGELLEDLDIVKSESRPIQERVVTAMSLSGLVSISMKILANMFQDSYLPSTKAYIAACTALKESGRLEELENFIYDLAETAKKLDASVDVVAWNTYLTALCNSIDTADDPTLDRLFELMNPVAARNAFCVTPDVTSYNTLLNVAARVRNRTLLESLWQELQNQPELQPDIFSYNSRLKISTCSDERLGILKEIEERHDVSPDAYTIDLLSDDLIKSGRFADFQSKVDELMITKSERQKSNSLAVFMITMVGQENIEYARMLFERCVLDGSTNCVVAADTRHFNILIDGYSKIAKFSEAKKQAQHSKALPGISESSINDVNLDTVQSDALAKGRKFCRDMALLGVKPDAYTLSSMMSLCVSSAEILELMDKPSSSLSPAVIRSAITYIGRLGDPSQACSVFDHYSSRSGNRRVWNVLLGALAEGAKQGNKVLNIGSTITRKRSCSQEGGGISPLIDGLTCSEAVQTLLNLMNGMSGECNAPSPNSQSYCLAATALQFESTDPGVAMQLFRNATKAGIPADGRFVNALLRCFGGNINEALKFWKDEIRTECIRYESRRRRTVDHSSSSRPLQKNLIAAYNGLLYVCGHAVRPDIAIRVAHAMNKEDIAPDHKSLNSYKAGKRHRKLKDGEGNGRTSDFSRSWPKFLPKPNMVEQYESLLYIECTKYNPNYKRMSKEQRVRIIL